MTSTTPPAAAPPRKARVLSGIQPTGEMHIGNYLGAVRTWQKQVASGEEETLFCVVDAHAITVPYKPAELRERILTLATDLIACGLEPSKTTLFVQSDVREHTELAWYLASVTPMGDLERMTQFKDKSAEAESVSSAYFTYPVLMSADILLYKATIVPVGDDQRQHLELANDIAEKFNHDYGVDFFPRIEALIPPETARIMSLRDGTKKMSKSDPSDQSRINLNDDADTIAAKIRRAKTDSEPLPADVEGLEGRPEAANLVSIFAAMTEQKPADVLAANAGSGFGPFKERLVEVLVEHLTPINARAQALLAEPGHVERILQDGARRAAAIADPIVDEAERLVGFLPRG